MNNACNSDNAFRTVDPTSVGVIFDFDGTLVDSLGAWAELESYLVSRSPRSLTASQREQLVAFTLPECAAFFHEVGGLGDSPYEVIKTINNFMLSYYQTKVKPLPGVLDFVRSLVGAGVQVSVASASPQSFLQAGLLSTGLAPYFKTVISVDDLNTSKREPLIYQHAQERMGTALEYTWGVEDSLYALNTLSRAGFRTLGVQGATGKPAVNSASSEEESGGGVLHRSSESCVPQRASGLTHVPHLVDGSPVGEFRSVADYVCSDFTGLCAEEFLAWCKPLISKGPAQIRG